jgi:hypothetical protein
MAREAKPNHPIPNQTAAALLLYLFLGAVFGVVLVKSEVLSWFRIQEMFRFQSPRMYEIIASAVCVAAASVALIKRLHIPTITGEPIVIRPRTLGNGMRYLLGGTIFGVGWALTGACPGPLFALVGAGTSVMIAAIASALAGTWVYGLLRTARPERVQRVPISPVRTESRG